MKFIKEKVKIYSNPNRWDNFFIKLLGYEEPKRGHYCYESPLCEDELCRCDKWKKTNENS